MLNLYFTWTLRKSGLHITNKQNLKKKRNLMFGKYKNIYFQRWNLKNLTRFKLSAGLNLETFDTILSGTIFKPRLKFKPPLKFFKFGHWTFFWIKSRIFAKLSWIRPNTFNDNNFAMKNVKTILKIKFVNPHCKKKDLLL